MGSLVAPFLVERTASSVAPPFGESNLKRDRTYASSPPASWASTAVRTDRTVRLFLAL